LSGYKKEAKNACAPKNAGKNPFTIKKDRPENSLILRMLRLLCLSLLTYHYSLCCKHHRSDSSGLESFLIVNVPAKGGAKEKREKWVLHFLSLLVLNSPHWRGARQGRVVFLHGMDSIITILNYSHCAITEIKYLKFQTVKLTHRT
jgi:hypothetical protein